MAAAAGRPPLRAAPPPPAASLLGVASPRPRAWPALAAAVCATVQAPAAAAAAATAAAADAPALHEIYNAYGTLTVAALVIVVATGTAVDVVTTRQAPPGGEREGRHKRLKDEDLAAVRSEFAKDIIRIQGGIGGVRGDIAAVKGDIHALLRDKASESDAAASDKVVAAIKGHGVRDAGRRAGQDEARGF